MNLLSELDEILNFLDAILSKHAGKNSELENTFVIEEEQINTAAQAAKQEFLNSTGSRWTPLVPYNNANPSAYIDVRSPGEYEKSHIPGAYNVPLFTDKERKQTGIEFKKNGPESAITLGLKFVEKRKLEIANGLIEIAKEHTSIIVYCFRGRSRSSSICYFISKLFPDHTIYRLEGGHKAYRTHVVEYVPKIRFHLITGNTGSGKTNILYELKKLGEQVIDLEQLANHRGSAFGRLGKNEQPSSSQFQNNLVKEFEDLDTNRDVFLEHEDIRIGGCALPPAIGKMLCKDVSILFIIKKSIEDRIETLLEEYGDFNSAALIRCLNFIKKRFGKKNTEQVMNWINNREAIPATTALLKYYDLWYDTGLEKRKEKMKNPIEKELAFEDNNYLEHAQLIIQARNNLS